MAEALACMDIGNMNFDKRNGNTRQGVTQCHAGMGKRRRVNNNKDGAIAAGGMNTVNQLVFGVALELLQSESGSPGTLAQLLFYIGQRGVAVNMRLTGAQQIQIRPLQYQNARHDDYPEDEVMGRRQLTLSAGRPI